MIKEVRKLTKEKAQYVTNLRRRGCITRCIHNGYAAYDTEELANYKRTKKQGRPCKKEN